ncbi:MAG TPA: hypothetical protein VFN39_09335, partial [Gemmatimonadaceae bacterium]|nr:hypothetical protein [Gemmatimonadaceae bacterium]
RAHRGGRDSAVFRPKGYRRLARRPQGTDALQIADYRLDLLGRAEPVGTRSDLFNEFGIYNEMIYTRAELMYGALRDALGDSTFAAFMHRYYADWALQHVDERAMRTTAELVSGDSLGWFFDQWLRRTGLTDYALTNVKTKRQPDGSWLTRGRVKKKGEYREAPPLGVRTSSGWTIARGAWDRDDQWIEVRTPDKPTAVRLDPLRTTEDWDRRNDAHPRVLLIPDAERRVRNVIDWPFLDQYDRDRIVNAWTPIAWYTTPNGLVGGIRVRSNYQGIVDRDESGLVYNAKTPVSRADRYADPRFEGWWIHENPRLPWTARPLMGVRTTLWTFDGVAGGEIAKTWDTSPFVTSRVRTSTHTLGATLTVPRGFGYLPARWDAVRVAEATYSTSTRLWRPGWPQLMTISVAGGTGLGKGAAGSGYARLEAAVSGVKAWGADSTNISSLRAYAGAVGSAAPLQRRIFASARDPYQTLFNHFVRPEGGILTRDQVATVPLGGAGLRGFDPAASVDEIGALNFEQGLRLVTITPGSRPLAIWGTLFADGGATRHDPLGDAGAGVMLRGWLFDRDVRVRVDLPVWVSNSRGRIGEGTATYALGDNVQFDRVQLTLGSFW